MLSKHVFPFPSKLLGLNPGHRKITALIYRPEGAVCPIFPEMEGIVFHNNSFKNKISKDYNNENVFVILLITLDFYTSNISNCTRLSEKSYSSATPWKYSHKMVVSGKRSAMGFDKRSPSSLPATKLSSPLRYSFTVVEVALSFPLDSSPL